MASLGGNINLKAIALNISHIVSHFDNTKKMINKSNLLKHREIYLSILLKEGVLRLQRYEEISIRTSFLNDISGVRVAQCLRLQCR